MPVISVIVPIYKVEPYLRPCVDSILAQTFTDFELILVDDGSPDNCGAICDEYAARDSRIHVIHQENGGLSAARNAGIDWAFANSDSQWLTFIDSDDMIHPEMLELMHRKLWEYDADICVCDLQSFLEESQIDSDAGTGILPRVLNNREACGRLYDDDGVKFTVACGKLYQKSLFSNLRFPIGKIHEDEATTYRALYACRKTVELGNKYYFYRVNPQSIMNASFSAKRFDALEAFRDREQFFKDRNEKELEKKTRVQCRTAHAELIILAEAANQKEVVPKQYKMRLSDALRCLRRELSDSKYTYYLAKVHPNWLRPHAYWRKIKKMLHIPCN